ncbi:TPA: hypothetical protein ACJ2XA_003777 [Kluyvera georgiana]
MSSYSGLERHISRLLSRFPGAKRVIKSLYSRLVFLKEKKTYSFKSLKIPTSYECGEKESFFGYYDKSPVNNKGWVLAQLSSRSTKKKPEAGHDALEIAVFNNKKELLLSIPIYAYNWQQGCRAHWLDDNLFIFNDFDSRIGHYVARVYSVSDKKQVKIFNYPVQDSFHKNYFISLNYRRLMSLRPDYGYRNLSNCSQHELNVLDNDGLWRIEYETGEANLLIKLSDACKIKFLSEFSQAVHKFNHVMISPAGKYFIFMHRYFLGQRRFDRLLLADAETGEMKLLNDYGMVSHCFWVNDSTVLGYMRGPEKKDGYWFIDIESGQYSGFAHEKMSGYGDGHPHVVGDWFVTDTYPDKARMQHLLLCNWKTGDVKEIGEFFHGFDYAGETRCDLHPRMSRDGKTIFFDSVFSGQRKLYQMEMF